ncbi:MAG: Na+/H+ antiporter NhaC family protein [Methanocalculaceae archaeon]|jgi:Na+/H+ antiporter NhaC|nr:Na+/H+ antiporter NhaC family protein [Methanocalculaceae archaeon]
MEKSKMVDIIALIVVFVAFAIPLATGFVGAAPEGGSAAEYAQILGIWTLIPPILALLLAFLTRNVILSLFLGVLSGAWMLALLGGDILGAVGGAFFGSTEYFIGTLADRWNAGIIMQVLVIGALIALITRMGGMRAVAETVARYATGPRTAQIATWIMGFVIFFDDYANALIVGPIMRPVCDKFRISRERLAYIVDSTAAPIAGIFVISTWIGTELVNINEGLIIAGITNVSAYSIFIDTIPYRFYNILALFFVFASAMLLREYGPMLTAELRARRTGATIRPGSEVEKDNNDIPDEYKDSCEEDHTVVKISKKAAPANIWNAVIPIGVLIVSALILFFTNGADAIMAGNGFISAEKFIQLGFFDAVREAYSSSDASIVLFQSALLACIVAIVMGFAQKIFTLKTGIETWAHGMRSMLFVCIILILAWSIGSIIGDLGTAHYLVSALSESLPMWIVPALIFIIAGIISFATGTSYGTMAILLPLVIPLAAAIAGFSTSTPDVYSYIVVCSSGVLTGAIFGDHCSPISDTTILSSMGAGCSLIDHVDTQLWYALTIAAVVVLGYIIVGLGISVWITLFITMVILVGVLLVLGKEVPTWKPDEEKLVE